MGSLKILKLKSGESILTKITSKKNGRFYVESPMLMKITSLADPFSGYRREVLTLQNWLEYTKSTKTAIPEDWIALFLTPNEQAEKLYESEVNRPEVTIEDLINKQKEEMEKAAEMDKMDISQIMMSFQMDENMFKKLVDEGILDEENMLGDDFVDHIDGSHDELELDGPVRPESEEDYGNYWRDWSSDLRDYL